MNKVEWETGDDFTTSSFLRDAGKYHLVINESRYPAAKKNGEYINNGLFTFACTVAGAANPANVNKTVELTLFRDKAGSSGFAKKKADRMLLAIGLLNKNQAGQTVAIDFADAVHRQFCVELELNREEGKPLQIAFAEIYHVDDPEVADWPKSKEMLGLIPAAQRRTHGMPTPPQPTQQEGNAFTSQFEL